MKLILCEKSQQSSGNVFRVAEVVAEIRIGGILKVQAKKLMVLLAEAVEANARVVSVFDPGECGLATSVMRRAVIGGRRREVLRVAFERGAIEMIERRNREHESGVEGGAPGKRSECVAFALGVTHMFTGAVPRIGRIEGHLIKGATHRGDKTQ